MIVDVVGILEEHLAVIKDLRHQTAEIALVAERMAECLRSGGKICWMGNGGSAADSQHFAAEIVGRYSRDRRGLPSMAFTTDTSILTAIGNDFGYDAVFARQVEALCGPNDVVVGLSTSGNSANVLRGLRKAKEIGAFTVGMTGGTGGQLSPIVDRCLIVPSVVTARIQEAHIVLGHIMCDWIEKALCDDELVR